LGKKLGTRGLFWGGGGLNLRVSPRPKFPIQFEWDSIIYRTSSKKLLTISLRPKDRRLKGSIALDAQRLMSG